MIKKLLLFALVLLAIGMAIPSTRDRIVAKTWTPAFNYVGGRIAPGQLRAMADQLDVRLGRGESMPSFEPWLRRDYTGPEQDPWDQPWFLDVGRRQYTVGSVGPDGEKATEDDIVVTRDLPNR